jgi:hypothetical protein
VASDIFGKDNKTNWARGSAPPPHSFEWCGVALPPGLPAVSGAAPVTAPVASPKKSKLWMLAKVGAALGLGYLIVTAEE